MGLDDFLSLGGHLDILTPPLSFQRDDFSTCSTHFFSLRQSPNKNYDGACTSIDHTNSDSCACNPTTMIGILLSIEYVDIH